MDRRKWKIKESSAEQRRVTLKRMVRLGSVMKALSKKNHHEDWNKDGATRKNSFWAI